MGSGGAWGSSLVCLVKQLHMLASPTYIITVVSAHVCDKIIIEFFATEASPIIGSHVTDWNRIGVAQATRAEN